MENGGELFLKVLQFDDLFFNGIFADEFVDGDWPSLTDAVCTVGGLLFGGDVPPRSEVDDDVRADEVEPCPACF